MVPLPIQSPVIAPRAHSSDTPCSSGVNSYPSSRPWGEEGVIQHRGIRILAWEPQAQVSWDNLLSPIAPSDSVSAPVLNPAAVGELSSRRSQGGEQHLAMHLPTACPSKPSADRAARPAPASTTPQGTEKRVMLTLSSTILPGELWERRSGFLALLHLGMHHWESKLMQKESSLPPLGTCQAEGAHTSDMTDHRNM